MSLQAGSSDKFGSRKINTKTLCDLIGSRYYPHNEEIEMDDEKIVNCFDENDLPLGNMTLRDSKLAAESAKKDVVLRNAKTDPPVVKIMNYKKELLKRLFKKLGKEMETKDMKSKQIRLATTISYHDLENKKKQAKVLLKTHQVLKFYMKVNIYDDENIQKGRMMLLNIAEDLKSDCRMVVSPVQQEKKQDQIIKKKDEKQLKPEEIEKAALESKQKRDDFVAIQHEDEDEKFSDAEDQPEYLYMELKSTASFKDIDIDTMLETTTFDEFMKGLYTSKISQTRPEAGGQENEFQKMMNQIFETSEDQKDLSKLKLDFNQEGDQIGKKDIIGDSLESQALASVRERRMRRLQSQIFDGSEKKKDGKQILQEQEEILDQSKLIDLTKQQEENQKDLLSNQVDEEMDVLDAQIDPFDVKLQLKKAKLKEELLSEKQKIKCKYIYQYARQQDDPFKLWS